MNATEIQYLERSLYIWLKDIKTKEEIKEYIYYLAEELEEI